MLAEGHLLVTMSRYCLFALPAERTFSIWDSECAVHVAIVANAQKHPSWFEHVEVHAENLLSLMVRR